FIAFNPTEKKFYKTNFQPIYERVEGNAPINQVSSKPESDDLPSKPLHYAKRVAARVIPQRIKQDARVRRVAARLSGLGVTHLLPAKELQEKKWTTFVSTDIVLVLGKPWDNLDIQRTLATERRRHKLKVVEVVYDLIICLEPQLQNPALIEAFT